MTQEPCRYPLVDGMDWFQNGQDQEPEFEGFEADLARRKWRRDPTETRALQGAGRS